MLRRIRFSCVPGSPDWSSHMPARCRNVDMCLADLAVYEIKICVRFPYFVPPCLEYLSSVFEKVLDGIV